MIAHDYTKLIAESSQAGGDTSGPALPLDERRAGQESFNWLRPLLDPEVLRKDDEEVAEAERQAAWEETRRRVRNNAGNRDALLEAVRGIVMDDDAADRLLERYYNGEFRNP